jgi:hypothetical protein
MKPEYKILLIGIFTIALFDTLGSIASRQFNFNYAFLAPVSFIIYGVFAFFAAKKKDLITGLFVATAMGLFDATFGWEISILLRANTGGLNNSPTRAEWIGAAMFVVLFAALVGLIGAGLAKIIYKKKN